MANYLRGAAQGLGRGMAEVGGQMMASQIEESRAKRLAQYQYDMTADDREATGRRADEKLAAGIASDEATLKVRQGELGVKQRTQSYKEFSEMLANIESRIEGLQELRVSGDELGEPLTPEQIAQINEDIKVQHRARAGMLAANEDWARRFGYGRNEFGEVDPDIDAIETPDSEVIPVAPEVPTAQVPTPFSEKQTRRSRRMEPKPGLLKDARGAGAMTRRGRRQTVTD